MSTKQHLRWANTAVSTRYGQGALPGAQSTVIPRTDCASKAAIEQ